MWRPTIKTGTIAWSPPPAACDVALEGLRKVRIKRQDYTHIIACPRLMTPLCMKQLFMCCDLVVATTAKWKHKKVCENEFEAARPDDHLLTPLQCDTCVFRRLHQRDPEPRSNSDNLLLAFIRRANIDAFWSRSSSTVKNTRINVQRTVEPLSMFGLSGPFYDPGPSTSHDTFVYETAISVLVDSQKAGRYSLSHEQWDTIRRVRKVKTAIGNI